MSKLSCKNIGFECEFEIEDSNDSKLKEFFTNHVLLIHKVNLTQESLAKISTNKKKFCAYCNSAFETKELLSKHIDQIHIGYGTLEGGIRGL